MAKENIRAQEGRRKGDGGMVLVLNVENAP
jgi:hypothetical protein